MTRAPLSVTVDDTTKVYGDENPTFTVTYGGFVLGEDAGVLGGELEYATEARPSSTVDDYRVAASGLASGNYAISYTAGTLKVTKAPLSVTTADRSRVYGDGNPDLSGTVEGTKNNDVLTASYTTDATQGSPAGSYDIVAGITGDALGNYDVTLVKGTLKVTKAPLSVTAADKTKVYGDANPALTGTVAGVKNGDAVTGAYNTAATVQSGVGSYPITAKAAGTEAVLANYAITEVGAKLTVTKAPLTVTADNKTKVFRAQNPALTGTVTGVKNGDAITESYSTAVTVDTLVGSYPIVPSVTGPALSNYDVKLVNGTLKITFVWDGFLQPINDTAHQTASSRASSSSARPSLPSSSSRTQPARSSSRQRTRNSAAPATGGRATAELRWTPFRP